MDFGCIGETLGHSYSAELHAMLANYPYQLLEICPESLDSFLKKKAFRGINVTIPYKEAVLSHLDWIDESAKRIGAVNTILNKNGALLGYNTDYYGLESLLQKIRLTLNEKKVFILGSGGTSRTAFTVAQDQGASEIYKVSRTPSAKDEISYDALYERGSEVDILINTTPVGMFPDAHQTPVDLQAFPFLKGVLDAIYNPLNTSLVLDAKRRMIPAVGGLYMLAAQAAKAASLFSGDASLELKLESAYRQLVAQKQNLVLIGMPGSGKSTLGGMLAKRLSLPFLDTDTEISSRLGEPIADYLKREGEASFRRVETQVISELSSKTGMVIATGGGIVECEKNLVFLGQNGKLIFLDRPLSSLSATQDRPLTATQDALTKKYAERYPKYDKAADIKLLVHGSPEETLKKLLLMLERL